MARQKKDSESIPQLEFAPAQSVEAQEQQMVALAINLAEQQLRDGTASAQVITHYLKLGTVNSKLEREKLIEENKLLRAKTEAIQSQQDIMEMYSAALDAMKLYQGNTDGDE